MLLTKTKQEILDILGVRENALKQIEARRKLSDRLNDKGYKFISKNKNGRTYIYIIEQLSSKKELLNNLTDALFNTRDDEKFGDYVLYRFYNIKKPITKKMLSEWCDISSKTVTKWDKGMVTNGFLNKDGFFYIAMDFDKNKNATYRITEKSEYNQYMKCSKYAHKKKEIAEKYKNEEIDYDTMIISIEGINKYAEMIESKFVYRISKYEIIKNNKLFMELIDLIEETRTENKLYYQDWLESV